MCTAPTTISTRFRREHTQMLSVVGFRPNHFRGETLEVPRTRAESRGSILLMLKVLAVFLGFQVQYYRILLHEIMLDVCAPDTALHSALTRRSIVCSYCQYSTVFRSSVLLIPPVLPVRSSVLRYSQYELLSILRVHSAEPLYREHLWDLPLCRAKWQLTHYPYTWCAVSNSSVAAG